MAKHFWMPFADALAPVNRKLLAARGRRVDLRGIRNEFFSKWSALETDLAESLKTAFERIIEVLFTILKLFEMEVAEGLEEIFVALKFEAAKTFGGLMTSLWESIRGTQRKIWHCVAMLSKRFAGVFKVSFVKAFASASGLSAAPGGTAPSVSIRQSYKSVPQ